MSVYLYDTTVQGVGRLCPVISDDGLRCQVTDDEMTSLLLQLRHEHHRRRQVENQLRRVQVRMLPLQIRCDIMSLMCAEEDGQEASLIFCV